MIEPDKYSLKLLSKQESDSFFTLIKNNQTRLEDFFAGTVAKTKTPEATKQYCEEIEKKIAQKTYFPYLIIENKTNLPIGFIDVKNIDWNIPKGELGAFIDSDFEGKGLVTYFGHELIDNIIIEHKFKKLFCRVAPHNKRSISVVERIGFVLEGTMLRDYKTTNGDLIDLNYYGRIFN